MARGGKRGEESKVKKDSKDQETFPKKNGHPFYGFGRVLEIPAGGSKRSKGRLREWQSPVSNAPDPKKAKKGTQTPPSGSKKGKIRRGKKQNLTHKTKGETMRAWERRFAKGGVKGRTPCRVR